MKHPYPEPIARSRRCVLVAGMHRSGSSVVTRVINLLAVDLAPALLPAALDDNDRGFCESARVAEIHDQLLHALGSSWDDPFSLPVSWLATEPARHAKRRLTEEINKDFSSSGLFVVEGPGLTRLLPLWLELLDDLSIQPVLIIPVRNPLEVAASLQRQNQLPRARSVLIYIQSYLEAELASRGRQRLFVRYDDFLSDSRTVADRLRRAIGAAPAQPTTDEVTAIGHFPTDLERHRSTRAQLTDARDTSATVIEIFERLTEAAETEDGTALHHAFDRLRDTIAEAAKLFQGLVLAERRTADAQAAGLRAEVARLGAQLDGARVRAAQAEEVARAERRGLYAIKLSASWRLTRPARSISEKLPWVARQVRRCRRMYWQALDFWLSPPVRRQLRLRRDLELIADSGIVDRNWYLEQNPDVRRSGRDPALHYLQFGAAEGRNPNPLFDNDYYLERNPDVREAGVNPAIHYLRHGAQEGRDPSPPFGKGHDRAPAGRPDGLARVFRTFYPNDDAQPVHRLHEILARSGGCVMSDTYFRAAPYLQALRGDICRLARSRNSGARLDASIVIPVHNNLVHTLCCLRAVLSWPTRAAFEIIVADDASTDATGEVISSIGGIVRHYRNPTNVGFLRNTNAGAAKARGDILVILNNDTIPLPGWLDELVDTLHLYPLVGLVGSKLLNPDGTLQEAGGIVWRDGSASNFGRGSDALLPPFNYLKDVDYLSAASIAIRKSDWDRLNGFDEIFSPAYYEDTDLAFRTRQLGLRTVYQPLSAVVHHEGASHGRDPSKGIKAYQARNSRVFFDRWKETLARDNFLPDTDVVLARDRSRGRPRILFIDHYIPQPDRDAGSRSVYDYLMLFKSAGFHVMLWPQNMHFDLPYATALQRCGIEVMYDVDTPTLFSEWLRRQAVALQYVFLSRPEVAIDFIESIRRETTAKILFYGHDIHFKRLAKEFALTGDRSVEVEMHRIEKIERQVWSQCDAIYYPSEEERDVVRAEHPDGSVQVIPLFQYNNKKLDAIRERLKATGIPRTGRLLFVGGFRHRPNVDGIIWFVREVWPRIVASAPGCRLWIAGSFPPAEIAALAGPGITVTGFISDEALRELYETAQVAIVPLRFGGGVKGKVIEALSYGTPVVATSTGTQGLSKMREVLDVCDTPEAFAGAVIDILRNPASHIGRALAGVRFVEIAASQAAARTALAVDVPELRSSEAHLSPDGQSKIMKQAV